MKFYVAVSQHDKTAAFAACPVADGTWRTHLQMITRMVEDWRKDRKRFIDEWLATGEQGAFGNLPLESRARIQAESNVAVIMHETFGSPIDPAAILERFDDLRGNRHATNFLNVTARNRLAVGNDSQRFKYRP